MIDLKKQDCKSLGKEVFVQRVLKIVEHSFMTADEIIKKLYELYGIRVSLKLMDFKLNEMVKADMLTHLPSIWGDKDHYQYKSDYFT